MSIFYHILGSIVGWIIGAIIYNKLKKTHSSKSKSFEILERSNVIQYDDMGYPLRLCIIREGGEIDQIWLDTVKREDDVILQWNKE